MRWWQPRPGRRHCAVACRLCSVTCHACIPALFQTCPEVRTSSDHSATSELFAELFGDEDEEDSEEDTNPLTRRDRSWSSLAEMKKTKMKMTAKIRLRHHYFILSSALLLPSFILSIFGLGSLARINTGWTRHTTLRNVKNKAEYHNSKTPRKIKSLASADSKYWPSFLDRTSICWYRGVAWLQFQCASFTVPKLLYGLRRSSHRYYTSETKSKPSKKQKKQQLNNMEEKMNNQEKTTE
ncbi:hypothetical protein AX14_005831 [Amanita brunnescens Koide BX004]|nr:hypothetical protein AX14_005831 [Amanita brunnescens Koide BX004]